MAIEDVQRRAGAAAVAKAFSSDPSSWVTKKRVKREGETTKSPRPKSGGEAWRGSHTPHALALSQRPSIRSRGLLDSSLADWLAGWLAGWLACHGGVTDTYKPHPATVTRRRPRSSHLESLSAVFPVRGERAHRHRRPTWTGRELVGGDGQEDGTQPLADRCHGQVTGTHAKRDGRAEAAKD
ncbi:hypothetical protein BC567DRAFT_80469 [Phyllosticta citribraziliensis]